MVGGMNFQASSVTMTFAGETFDLAGVTFSDVIIEGSHEELRACRLRSGAFPPERRILSSKLPEA